MSDPAALPPLGSVVFGTGSGRSQADLPALFVRVEDGEAFLVLTHDRVVYTRRVPVESFLDEYRTEYLAPERRQPETGREQAERGSLDDLLRERDALLAAMRDATGRLSPEDAAAVRAIYREAMA